MLRVGLPGGSDESRPTPGQTAGAPTADHSESIPPDEASQGDHASAEERRTRRLVRRLRQGDERAFEGLVQVYQDRVFGLIFRMIGNRQEAEDLAQEVFITVHRSIHHYRGDGRFQTWLYRIASNTCRNRIKYLRGRQIDRKAPIDDDRDGPSDRGHPPTHGQIPGPEAATVGHRLEAAVQHELAALEPDLRLLIVLRDVEGLSYQDITRITGLSPGTMKSRLHRARLLLKERLQRHLR